MNYHALIALLSTVLLVSCASTGVIPMSQDSYYIGKKDGSVGLGVSLTNKTQVYKEAYAFCREKGLDLLVIQETVTPSAPARLGSTELYFKCVESSGTVQPSTKKPDTILLTK